MTMKRTLTPTTDYIQIQGHLPETANLGTVGYGKAILLEWLRDKTWAQPTDFRWDQDFSFSLPGRGHQLHVANSSHGFAFSTAFKDGSNPLLIEGFLRAHDTGEVRFGVRYNLANGRLGTNETLEAPTFLHLFKDNDYLRIMDAGLAITNDPRTIVSKEDIDDLKNFISQRERNLPVIVVAEQNVRGSERGVYHTDPDDLANRLFGIAHVYKLPYPWANSFSRRMPRNEAVFNGGVRYYRPNGAPAITDEGMEQSPLANRHIVMEMNDFVSRVVNAATLENRMGLSTSRRVLSYQEVSKEIQLQHAREMNESAVVTDLRDELRSLREENALLNDIATSDAENAEKIIAELQSQCSALKIENEQLQLTLVDAYANGAALPVSGKKQITPAHESFQDAAKEIALPSPPSSGSKFSAWVEEHYGAYISIDSKVAKEFGNASKIVLSRACSVVQFLALLHHKKIFNVDNGQTCAPLPFSDEQFVIKQTAQGGEEFEIKPKSATKPEHNKMLVVRPNMDSKTFVIKGLVPFYDKLK